MKEFPEELIMHEIISFSNCSELAYIQHFPDLVSWLTFHFNLHNFTCTGRSRFGKENNNKKKNQRGTIKIKPSTS